jgi:hypothetical protein
MSTPKLQGGRADLKALQGKIKRDPEGYKEEFLLQFRHYHALLVRRRWPYRSPPRLSPSQMCRRREGGGGGLHAGSRASGSYGIAPRCPARWPPHLSMPFTLSLTATGGGGIRYIPPRERPRPAQDNARHCNSGHPEAAAPSLQPHSYALGAAANKPELHEQRESCLRGARRRKSSQEIFKLRPSKDSAEFANLVDFVSHVSPCYPMETAGYAAELMSLLDGHHAVLDATLRRSAHSALLCLSFTLRERRSNQSPTHKRTAQERAAAVVWQ